MGLFLGFAAGCVVLVVGYVSFFVGVGEGVKGGVGVGFLGDFSVLVFVGDGEGAVVDVVGVFCGESLGVGVGF